MTVPPISYARSADGVSLAFTTAGHGPALVFVPWVPFSNFRVEWQSAFLGGIFERLARRLTVIHYDGRGTGHSQRDVTDVSPDAMVADLEAVVGQVGAAEVSMRASVGVAVAHDPSASAEELSQGATEQASSTEEAARQARIAGSRSRPASICSNRRFQWGAATPLEVKS